MRPPRLGVSPRFVGGLLAADAAYLLYPWPVPGLDGWPAVSVGGVTLILSLGAAVRRPPGRPLRGSVLLSLGALVAVALAVKAFGKTAPLLPLVLFVGYPASAFADSMEAPPQTARRSRLSLPSAAALRHALLPWVPAALLGGMAAGPAVLLRDDVLLPWAAGLALFSLLFSGTVGREVRRIRAKVGRVERLESDAGDMMRRIKDGGRIDIDDPRRHIQAAAIGALHQENRLLEQLMRLGCHLFGVRTCLLLRPRGVASFEIGWCAHRKGITLREAEIPADKGFLHLARMRGGTLVVNDARSSGTGLPFYGRDVEVGSFLVRELRDQPGGGPTEGPVRAVLFLDSPEPDHFESGEPPRGLDDFSRLVVETMASGEALRQISEDMAAKTAISGYARGLTATLDPREIAEDALRALRETLPACEAAAFLVSPSGGEGRLSLTVVAASGEAFAGLEGTVVGEEERSQVGHILRRLRDERDGQAASDAASRGYEIFHEAEKARKHAYFAEGERLGKVVSFGAVPCLLKRSGGPLLAGMLVAASSRPGLFPQPFREDLLTLADITAPALQNAFKHQEVNELSRLDGLTGLLNHRTFQDVLGNRILRASRYQPSFAVLMVDADHFKRINDTHGHPVGDEVLRELARRLQAGVRGTDSVARYGGEEFAIILDQVDTRQAFLIAEKIRRGIETSPFPTKAGPLPVTVSAGYFVYQQGANLGRQEILDRADRALYHAKSGGRNRVVGYQDIEPRSAAL